MAGGGYQRLWGWFGLSRASFAVLPRVLMHEMPDEWQGKMASLLEEFDEAFPGKGLLPFRVTVGARDLRGRRFVRFPYWLLAYRHPDRDQIEALKRGDAA